MVSLLKATLVPEYLVPEAGNMHQLILLAVPLVMILAGIAERRYGPALAGTVTALPFSVIPAVLVVAGHSGLRAATALTISLGAHSAAQVCFGVILILAIKRRPVTQGLGIAAASYALVSAALAFVPAVAACAAGAAALFIARRQIATHEPAHIDGTLAPDTKTIAIRALVAWLAAVTLATAAGATGPEIGGAIGAFPTLSTVLAVMVSRRSGPAGLVNVISGLIKTLPVYLCFCLTFTASATAMPIGGALALATLAAAIILAYVSPRQPSSPHTSQHPTCVS